MGGGKGILSVESVSQVVPVFQTDLEYLFFLDHRYQK